MMHFSSYKHTGFVAKGEFFNSTLQVNGVANI